MVFSMVWLGRLALCAVAAVPMTFSSSSSCHSCDVSYCLKSQRMPSSCPTLNRCCYCWHCLMMNCHCHHCHHCHCRCCCCCCVVTVSCLSCHHHRHLLHHQHLLHQILHGLHVANPFGVLTCLYSCCHCYYWVTTSDGEQFLVVSCSCKQSACVQRALIFHGNLTKFSRTT